jgi:N-acetylglucosaminyl-diphospho-decaprenol L-rhamnosyltransferase
MDISFAIVNWKGGSVFEKCVASIEEAIAGSSLVCEVVVVDNGSAEKELAFLSKYTNIVLVRNPTNLGFARGTNQSIEKSLGKYLFILNNDVILKTRDLSVIYRFMEENLEVGVLAPKLLYPNGRVQESISGLPDLLDVFSRAFMLSKINPKWDRWEQVDFDYTKVGEALQPMFSALFMRKDVWHEIGPLDERFPLLFNDVDWFFRFHEMKRWKCIFYPYFTCIHYHKMSVDRRVLRKSYLQATGLYRYFVKNHNLGVAAYLFLVVLCCIIFLGKLIIEPSRKLRRALMPRVPI